MELHLQDSFLINQGSVGVERSRRLLFFAQGSSIAIMTRASQSQANLRLFLTLTLTTWIRTNQATCPLVDREWFCRPPHYSPPKI